MSKELNTNTDDIAALKQELEALRSQIRGIAPKMAQPENQMPEYEIINEPYFSPDCIWWPIGAQFTDISGRIIPNASMLPLNKAAEERVRLWQQSLPIERNAPTVDYLIEAAFQNRPRHGEQDMDKAQFQRAMLESAITMMQKDRGIAPAAEPQPRMTTMPSRPDGVPLMSNTKIQGNNTGANQERLTRMKREPLAPAHKEQPAMGTIHNPTTYGASGAR